MLENSQQHNPLLHSFPDRKTVGKLTVYRHINHMLTLQPMVQRAKHILHLLMLHFQPLAHFTVPIFTGKEIRLVIQGHGYEWELVFKPSPSALSFLPPPPPQETQPLGLVHENLPPCTVHKRKQCAMAERLIRGKRCRKLSQWISFPAYKGILKIMELHRKKVFCRRTFSQEKRIWFREITRANGA